MRLKHVAPDGALVYSKPWDFEALVRMDDARNNLDKDGHVLEIAVPAIAYLWEEYEDTADFTPSDEELLNWSATLVHRYQTDLEEAFSKKKENPWADHNKDTGKLSDLYSAFFKGFGVAPDVIGRQRVDRMLSTIVAISNEAAAEEAKKIESLPGEIRALYGM